MKKLFTRIDENIFKLQAEDVNQSQILNHLRLIQRLATNGAQKDKDVEQEYMRHEYWQLIASMKQILEQVNDALQESTSDIESSG